MRRPCGVVLSDFRIFETDEFLKSLSKLSPHETTFIRNKLNIFVYPQLRKMPYRGKNIKKLRGYTPDTWRYRIGRFRLFYIVDKDTQVIFLLTLDDRKDAYR